MFTRHIEKRGLKSAITRKRSGTVCVCVFAVTSATTEFQFSVGAVILGLGKQWIWRKQRIVFVAAVRGLMEIARFVWLCLDCRLNGSVENADFGKSCVSS